MEAPKPEVLLEAGIGAHERGLKDTPKVLNEVDGRLSRMSTSAGKISTLSEEGKASGQKRIPADALCRPWDTRRAFVKWAGPCLTVGFCGYIGSAGLHVASYHYVHEMNAWNRTVVDGAFATQGDRALAHDVLENFSSIPDPIETNFLGPRVQIRMQVLDMLALAFPALFTLLAVYTKRCDVWTKVMLCTALLAACKGIIGALTTVPDSSGWEVCRDQHLGPDGYAFLSQDLSFRQIVGVDFWWFLRYHRPLRYCSDMMFSGHTFFVTLYALGLYEVALIYTSTWHAKDPESSMDRGKIAFYRACVLTFVSLAAIGQQVGEIYFVLLSRFHYSSDVFVALLLTFLFYTNGSVCIAAKQWALRDVHFLLGGRGALSWSVDEEAEEAGPAEELGQRKKLKKPKQLKKWGEDEKKQLTLVDVETRPICCFLPFLLWAKEPVENPPYRDKNQDPSSRRRTQGIDMFVSRGDVLVPWCCVPFCCLAGREHIYSDEGVNTMKRTQNSGPGASCDNCCHIGEGISMSDAVSAISALR